MSSIVGVEGEKDLLLGDAPLLPPLLLRGEWEESELSLLLEGDLWGQYREVGGALKGVAP